MHGFSSRPNGSNQYLPRHKMGGPPHSRPMSSRRQRIYIKYGIIAVLLLVIILNWRSTVDEVEAISPYTVSITPKEKEGKAASSATREKAGEKGAVAAPRAGSGDSPKVAIVTFTTSEKSYTYLSLRNKHAYAKKHNYDLIVDYTAPESRDVGIMWHKFTMMERLITAGTHDWIWWIDFDTLVTNLDIRLDDIITESLYNVSRSVFPPAKEDGWKTTFNSAEADGQNPDEVDLLLTADCFPLNAGSMLVRGRVLPGSTRKSPLTSAQFLGRVREYHKANASYEHQLSEQDCMRDLLFEYDKEYTKKHVHMIPQWKTNAFPDEIKCWDNDQRGWEVGTFVIHFAGAWAHVKGEDPTGFLMRKYEGQIVGEKDDDEK